MAKAMARLPLMQAISDETRKSILVGSNESGTTRLLQRMVNMGENR
jgi:hypothetical protein